MAPRFDRRLFIRPLCAWPIDARKRVRRHGGSRALRGRGHATRREGRVKIRAIHNYAEDTGRGVILVEAPPAAPRGQAKELNRGGSQLAKITAIGAIILLI